MAWRRLKFGTVGSQFGSQIALESLLFEWAKNSIAAQLPTAPVCTGEN